MQTRAVDDDGRPTFAILHETDPDSKLVRVPRGTLPSMHSFRQHRCVARVARGGGRGRSGVLARHRDGTVTRTVYVREVADARRRALRRSRMAAEYPGALRVALDGEKESD